MPLYLLRELEKSGRHPFQMEADELVEAVIALHSVLGSAFPSPSSVPPSSPDKLGELIRIT
jgi:hypothetical protein